nr:PDR/VanB family oxidoreductase [Halomonas cerina]
MHHSVRPGDILTIGTPRNNFVLDEDVGHTVLIAGGIGITPLYGMIQRLDRLGRSWQLFYASRARKNAAFLAPLHKLAGDHPGRLNLNFDQETGGALLDLPAIIESAPTGTHFYCCGPLPMLDAFETAARHQPPERVHVEYFAAREGADTSGGFTVELAQSGTQLFIPQGKTILDALLEEGYQPLYSCQEGICGTCEVKVLEGEPDHRDLVLSAQQKKNNNCMMICCSGCKGEKLVLDM